MQQTDGQIKPTHRQIIDALNAVLESDKFTAAPQMSAFLRYVVEQAASGNMTRIKAYTVAIDALGKPDSFDPQNDPVVRVLAGRLRAALATYYEANPNVDLRITMRPGSYVPTFVHRSAIEETEKTTAISPSEATPKTDASRHTIESVAIADLSEDENTPLAVANASEQTPSNETAQSQPEVTKNSDNRDFATRFSWLFRLPTVGITLAILGILVGAQLTQHQESSAPESRNASSKAAMTAATPLAQRDRPEQISLFVSALKEGNSLYDQLNTMISGVFSESDAVHVYRVFDPSQPRQHWPEDYLVSVDILPLPSETRISVQLVEAQTGRVTYSKNLSLSKNATDGLNSEELVTITAFARQLISENGPLFNDYNAKTSSSG